MLLLGNLCLLVQCCAALALPESLQKESVCMKGALVVLHLLPCRCQACKSNPFWVTVCQRPDTHQHETWAGCLVVVQTPAALPGRWHGFQVRLSRGHSLAVHLNLTGWTPQTTLRLHPPSLDVTHSVITMPHIAWQRDVPLYHGRCVMLVLIDSCVAECCTRVRRFESEMPLSG